MGLTDQRIACELHFILGLRKLESLINSQIDSRHQTIIFIILKVQYTGTCSFFAKFLSSIKQSRLFHVLINQKCNVGLYSNWNELMKIAIKSIPWRDQVDFHIAQFFLHLGLPEFSINWWFPDNYLSRVLKHIWQGQKSKNLVSKVLKLI